MPSPLPMKNHALHDPCQIACRALLFGCKNRSSVRPAGRFDEIKPVAVARAAVLGHLAAPTGGVGTFHCPLLPVPPCLAIWPLQPGGVGKFHCPLLPVPPCLAICPLQPGGVGKFHCPLLPVPPCLANTWLATGLKMSPHKRLVNAKAAIAIIRIRGVFIFPPLWKTNSTYCSQNCSRMR